MPVDVDLDGGQGEELARFSRRYSYHGELGRPRSRVTARCRFFHRRSLLQSHAGFQPPVLHVIIRLKPGIVPAVLERLCDLDRPEDLARCPGPLE